eukprot:COSAG01_NODE_69189_length_262_cov_0.619632_1_plen_48_part_10
MEEVLESVHVDCDLPMSRLVLSRNIEDENGRGGGEAARCRSAELEAQT